MKRERSHIGLLLQMFAIMASFYIAAQVLFLSRVQAAELGMVTSHTWQSDYAASSISRKWQGEVIIDQTATPGPVSHEALRSALELASWSVGERTGLSFKHAGIAPSEAGGASRRVTFVWSDSVKMQAMGMSKDALAATSLWYYMDTGIIAGAIVYLDSFWWIGGVNDCNRHTLLHELIHAIGVQGHTSDRHDVMYASQSHCRAALSARDVYLAGYQSNVCHSELMADGSVYIPAAGVWLKPESGKAKVIQDGPDSACDTVTVQGDKVTVHDTRGKEASFKSVQLQHAGGDYWQVTEVVE